MGNADDQTTSIAAINANPDTTQIDTDALVANALTSGKLMLAFAYVSHSSLQNAAAVETACDTGASFFKEFTYLVSDVGHATSKLSMIALQYDEHILELELQSKIAILVRNSVLV